MFLKTAWEEKLQAAMAHQSVIKAVIAHQSGKDQLKVVEGRSILDNFLKLVIKT